MDCPLDSVEEVGERRMLAKLTFILNNSSHRLYETVGALNHHQEHRSIFPASVRVSNTIMA